MSFTKTPGGSLRRAGRPVGSKFTAPVSMASPQGDSPQEGSPQEDTEERLMRVSRRQDKFFIDPRLIPDGWSYEWKRVSVYGQPDPDHMINLKSNHWRPVPLARHPNMMPGISKDGETTAIIKDGQMLMERPLYLTIDAQQEDYEIAVGQVQKLPQDMTNAPVGTFARSGNRTLDATTGIRRSFRPLVAED